MQYILLIITVLFGISRFTLPVHGQIVQEDIFKDLAHVFVGFLFGYAVCSKNWKYWSLAIGLTVLEVVAFLVRRI